MNHNVLKTTYTCPVLQRATLLYSYTNLSAFVLSPYTAPTSSPPP